MKKLFVALIFVLTGCASGSHILIGNVRQPIPVSEVKVYLDEPEKYEVIALVRGESVSGWTQQQDTNNALNTMKEEAAKLGANGVILTNVSEGTGSLIGSSMSNKADLSGKAIYVLKD